MAVPPLSERPLDLQVAELPAGDDVAVDGNPAVDSLPDALTNIAPGQIVEIE